MKNKNLKILFLYPNLHMSTLIPNGIAILSAVLKNAGFKLCIVSPELQGRSDHNHIMEFRSKIELLGINGDAVCTKYPDLWA